MYAYQPELLMFIIFVNYLMISSDFTTKKKKNWLQTYVWKKISKYKLFKYF